MSIGTSSVYTVGNYDGMVLVIDPYGGKVGFLPGEQTRSHANVPRVEAFGDL